MRWPFVSRATHEALIAAKDAEFARMSALFDQMADRFWKMADRCDALTALAMPKPAPLVTAKPRREPDAVDTAIDWVAGDDLPKRRYLERFTKTLRREGMDATAIAARVMEGDRMSTDDDDAGIPS